MSEILAMTLSRGAVKRSAVTLTRSASGDTLIDVTVATSDDTDVQTVEDAEQRAREVYDRLETAYPSRGGHENASTSLTRNAKGETQIEVTIRPGDHGTRTLPGVVENAAAEYDRLRGKYPMADGTSAKPGSVA
jgi:hypothetical protein